MLSLESAIQESNRELLQSKNIFDVLVGQLNEKTGHYDERESIDMDSNYHKIFINDIKEIVETLENLSQVFESEMRFCTVLNEIQYTQQSEKTAQVWAIK